MKWKISVTKNLLIVNKVILSVYRHHHHTPALPHVADCPGQRNETGGSASRLTANKLGLSCRQMALMNLQSLLIASNRHRPATIAVL